MNIVETVRVVFTKTGRAKYISHLDLMRTMTRVLRRAGIPLWYTEGFSKHPYITFAAPLSLGFESDYETMDFRLEEPMSHEEIVARLNANMPQGIVVLSAATAVMKAGKITASRWELCLPLATKERVEEVLAQDTIEVQKRTKKKTLKALDIKPFIRDMEMAQQEERLVLTVTLPTGEQAINPTLLLQAFGVDLCNVTVKRLTVFAENGDIFV